MHKVLMPKAGQTMETGTILHWHKQEGETIQRGDPLLDVDTDKAAVEIEAPESGVLRKILCPEGTSVPVLAPIAIIARPGEDVDTEIAAALAEFTAVMSENLGQPGAAPEGTGIGANTAEDRSAASSPDTPKASPAARRISREIALDLGQIAPGSGPHGRILSNDVLRAAQAAATHSKPEPASGALRRPLAGMRKAVAGAMLSAKQRIPHFYMKLTIDADPLFGFYQMEKSSYPCTINDVITLACARVIKEFPAFRSRMEEESIVEFPAASIGIAVGMDDGLAVPVVVGAESMTLKDLAAETERIVQAARHGKIIAMGRGVFTVSNLGGFGVEEFTAIINPPESAILAVGAIREAVLVKDAGLRPGRVMTLTLSADHRLIDGLMAARFLDRLRKLLEAPEELRRDPA